MSNITFKPEANYYSDDHKAVRALTAEKPANIKTKKAKRDKILKSMDNESSEPTLTARLDDLIARRVSTPPTPLDVQLREVQIEIRDEEDDLIFLDGKEKLFQIEAQKRMLDEAKPQIVAAERELFETFSKFYSQYLPYWQARQTLRGNSIRTFELFSNSFDEFLGIPVDINSAFCELFREGIKAGYISRMPTALRPKA
jgi:hypothetical protein